jgi:hypothetical protein
MDAMKQLPNQSAAMSKAMAQKWRDLKSGALGIATSSIAEPIAGLNALMRGDPSLVDSTREALTYGNPADAIPRNLMMPDYVVQGVDYFNESADRLGERSPVLGAALRTAPAFVGAMASPLLRTEGLAGGMVKRTAKLAEKAGNVSDALETEDQKRLRIAKINREKAQVKA